MAHKARQRRTRPLSAVRERPLAGVDSVTNERLFITKRLIETRAPLAQLRFS